MQNVTVLIGLPGSGKGTVAREMVKNAHITGKRRIVIVSLDNIREMLNGEYFFDDAMELMVWTISRAAIHIALRNHYDIIIDDSLLSATARNRDYLCGFLRSLESDIGRLSITAMQLQTPLSVCIDRRMAEPRSYAPEKWREVITRIYEMYEPICDPDSAAHSCFDRVVLI